MNRNDFLGLIGNNPVIDRQTVAELSELVNIYPYFQTAHLLLLKGLRDNQDVRFENQLKISAIHIADREVLHNLLMMTPEMEKAADIQEVYEEVQTVQVEEKISLPVDAAEPAEATDDKANTIGAITAEPESAVKADAIPEKIIPQPEPELVPGDTGQTVIDAARNSEDLINEIEKESAERYESNGEEIYDHIPGHQILISDDADSETAIPGVYFIREEQEDEEERIFYMDPGFSVPESETEQEADKFTTVTETAAVQPQDNTPAAEVKESESVDTRNSTRKVQADLIDKFISANPRIEPRRETPDHPVEDLAMQFTEEKGSFITETLARIYINQGYYSKAIEIYEKLCLKFPEKSSYFASQIELVKVYLKK